MFIGHYAPAAALSVRKDAPPARTLFIAAQFVETICSSSPCFRDGNAPRTTPPATPAALPFALDAPFTHSLAGTAVRALLFGALPAYTLFAALAARALRKPGPAAAPDNVPDNAPNGAPSRFRQPLI